jgi:transglutaminase-like putative cysteine protease
MDTTNFSVDSVYLAPSLYMDFNSLEVATFVAKHAKGTTDKEIAISLYYAVRDGFWYDPYHVNMSHKALKASSMIERGSGYCVEKANFLAAVARACNIPARLGFAIVRNHIGTEKLQEILRSDLFVFHGYTELYIDGQWVKATPAFNKELCERFNVTPLEFDGEHDSVFQEYDAQGNKHMEYLHDYGIFAEVPRDLMVDELKKHYPHLFKGLGHNDSGHYFTAGNEE